MVISVPVLWVDGSNLISFITDRAFLTRSWGEVEKRGSCGSIVSPFLSHSMSRAFPCVCLGSVDGHCFECRKFECDESFPNCCMVVGWWLIKWQRDGEAKNPGPTELVLADLIPDEVPKGQMSVMTGLFSSWDLPTRADGAELKWNSSYPFEAIHLRTNQCMPGQVDQCMQETGDSHKQASTDPPVVCPLTGCPPGVGAAGAPVTPTPTGSRPTDISACDSKSRKRRTDGASVVSYNGNCWSTAQDFLLRTDAAVVTLQETKVDGDKLKEAEEWSIRNGWKPFFAPCLRSSKGEVRAGVAVMVRKHISACAMPGPWPGLTPAAVLDGWCAAVHVDYGLKGGLIIGSVYLECGVGLGQETDNWQRICRIGEMLNHYGKPFLLGGGLERISA